MPLARDVAAAQRAARLKPEATTRTVELDLRTPNGLRRSHLLHRLTGDALARGERLESLEVARPTLEDVYLELTAEDDR